MPEPIAPPLNPDYGEGAFHRRIRLQGEPGRVIAELEDCCHGFRSVIDHDGETVTGVSAETLRIPLDTCTGAIEPIRALVGVPLTATAPSIFRQVDPRANCTHLFDLSLLAVAHARRGECTRTYDVVIEDELPDDPDRPVASSVQLDGREILHWLTSKWQITAPASIEGNSLHRGFSAWARSHFQGDEREAAFILHKGYFVAQARRYDMDSMAGDRAYNHEQMRGVCYSYAPGVVERARRLAHSVRDFNGVEERLLKFL